MTTEIVQEIIHPYWHSQLSFSPAAGTIMTNVLCSDGKYRTARFTTEPDTFFTQPARITVSGKTVSGFIWRDSSYNDYEGIWKFTAYSYRKNGYLLPEWK